MSDSSSRGPHSFRTRAIHVGNEIDPATGAVVPPIHLASTFRQPGAGQWGEFDYSRSGNPTRSNLQTTLASLESGVGALAFASGMAAIHCVTMLLPSSPLPMPADEIFPMSMALPSLLNRGFGRHARNLSRKNFAAAGESAAALDASGSCLALQKLKYLLRQRICLRHHGCARLLQDLGARQVGRLSREVGVHDAAPGSCLVFRPHL